MEAADSYWSRVARARVSRRRLIAGSALLTGGAVAWAACGGEDGDATQQEPQRGGTLRLGTTTPYSGLDPQTEAGTGLEITARLYGYMMHADSRDDSIVYDQAESVEQPDDLTSVFKLARGRPLPGRRARAWPRADCRGCRSVRWSGSVTTLSPRRRRFTRPSSTASKRPTR